MEENFRARRQRITIQRKTSRRNSVGEVLIEFEKLYETWAQIGEGWVTLRFHPALQSGQRVVVAGNIFEIEKIVEVPSRHRLLKLEISDVGEHAPRARRMQSSQRFLAMQGIKPDHKEYKNDSDRDATREGGDYQKNGRASQTD